MGKVPFKNGIEESRAEHNLFLNSWRGINVFALSSYISIPSYWKTKIIGFQFDLGFFFFLLSSLPSPGWYSY